MAFVSDMVRKSFGSSRNVSYKFKELRAQSLGIVNGSGIKPSRFLGKEKLLDKKDKFEIPPILETPKWVDVHSHLTSSLITLEEDIKLTERLIREKSLNAFKKENSSQQEQIFNRAQMISKKIQEINMMIKTVSLPESSENEKTIQKNLVSSLKMKLKESTLRFRKIQAGLNSQNPQILSDKIYNFCDESEHDEGLIALAPHISDGINALATNMIDLADIFRELNECVLMQGTIFDRIDCSIRATVDNTKNSVKHLTGAQKHQKCTRAAYCILCLLVIILLLIVFLGLKIYL